MFFSVKTIEQIAAYSVFLIIAFLAQLGSIFTSLELRSIIAQAGVKVKIFHVQHNKFKSY
jgi:hypothetical protein